VAIAGEHSRPRIGGYPLAAGLIALLWPGLTAVVLTIVIAAWALVTGITGARVSTLSGRIFGCDLPRGCAGPSAAV
jgi:hypothetical protein